MNAKVENTQELVTIEVDGVELQAPKGAMLIEATDRADIPVPRFCYHKKLSIAANCRMCLVEVEKAPKPMPACATPVADGMKVFTRSERALAAQRGVMEFLLINHPLDCPICDQGGECELQDLSMGYGRGVSRFSEGKRVVKDEDLGPLVETEMTRCIHCTRCVRFLQEIGGRRELGGIGRGEHTEIGTYVQDGVSSELSGNIIDLCPVGALTSKPFRYRARAWELLSHPSVAPHDAVGSNVHIHHRRGELMRVVPRENEGINETWLADRDRFGYAGLYSEQRLARPMVKEQGEWREVDWETALAAAVKGTRRVQDVAGAEALGTLVAPNATLEEMFLLGKLSRGLGSRNIDSRLRQGDFSDDAEAPLQPALGVSIAELEAQDAVLAIGSYSRLEQPLVNHRLRKASLKGAQVMYLNTRAWEFNFEPALQQVATPATLVAELAAVARVLLDREGQSVPQGLEDVLAGLEPGEAHQRMADELHKATRSLVLLGSQAESHPAAASLRALASLVAELSGATLGQLPVAANSVGGWLAGALPHRGAGGKPDAAGGLNARAMVEQPRKAYWLFNVEPEFDCWDGAAAAAAVAQAEFVVAFTPFVTESLKDQADVLLPIASFGETSGTFVNLEGRWQSFGGVTAPVGEGRPAWRVLRVLGNLFDLDGFEHNSSEEVLAELKASGLGDEAPAQRFPWREPRRGLGEGLVRGGEVPPYQLDTLLRRSAPLQASAHAAKPGVYLAAEEAQRLGFAEGERARVRQGEGEAQLTVYIDDTVAAGSVWIPAALCETYGLGAPWGEVRVERA
ncbi:NADH-quinone oxidoreductase subunit NuoG [Alkalilimnicola sp. S0819]|uniref:NADH-quinone oxidoreductase subunit NuoG n=1 Tax=Alkalilimnicola sp. S0819 TaxID=2613922 RepID=UPI00126252F2|nr:NADH-quinone oxidoreductase subunit NuoG [Alkalilimnicola sp. S0819]KAB7628431.1 NADH-quinone oxidoreductase subunit G [Alkalilimnicola sp. S0819]MPQ15335.1 NADH-quinone oxidoreductase subunit G [Alkalilimnicola sp. S0819]